MADFQFLKNSASNKWVILAPRRSKRTNAGKKPEAICPFCIGREKNEPELYRVGGSEGDENWHIRVVANKFPFAPHHEIIIHSPDHHKNFDELPFSQVEIIMQTYKRRFEEHAKKGTVYIFHNRGLGAGESIPHPHTQLVVIPNNVTLEVPPLNTALFKQSMWFNKKGGEDFLEMEQFFIFCPSASEWPDEVWIAPKQQGKFFGDIKDMEITDFAFVLARVIQLMDLRHDFEFPFNFYIYPGKNWYLRLIPRIKILGGFELGTQISVNTQVPSMTIGFLKEHFWEPDVEKIRTIHQADYLKSV